MEKVLVIRYGTIGDTVFASAFYRELRKALDKDARIDVLVDKTAKGVIKNCPYINNIVEINGKYKNLFNYLKIFKKYDTVYLLKNDNFFSKITCFAGIKNRIGFDIKRNKFLTLKAPYKEDRHEIDCYLDLLRLSNIPVTDTSTELWLNPDDNEKIKPLISNTTGKKILIQAYSRFKEKNWLDDYWAEVITHLSNNLKAQIYFVGGKKDLSDYQILREKIQDKLNIEPINLCGELTISQTMSLVNSMDLVIGIDSGIIHIAAALDIPSILLHGPTSIIRWKPRSEKCTVLSQNYKCSPCCLQSSSSKLCKNKTPECMKSLSPSIVIQALDKILASDLKQI